MADLSVVHSSLADYFRMIQAEIHQLTEPLSSEQLWVRPYPYGNSIGNLILHLTGNLNYYIGAQIGGTGYVRQRPLEFSSSGKPKVELLSDFDQAIEIVIATIASQSDDAWAAPYISASLKAKPRPASMPSCDVPGTPTIMWGRLFICRGNWEKHPIEENYEYPPTICFLFCGEA